MQDEIASIIVYGSHARGDADSLSDKDVCVITNCYLGENIDDVKKTISVKYHTESENISVYSIEQLQAMLEYGSLFLWHLKIEGKIVYGESYFKSKLNELKPFRKHREEILFYEELISDVDQSTQRYGIINEIDLAQLFTITRNTCMILDHIKGESTFGRKNVFFTAKSIYHDLPLSLEDYDYITKWKLRFERGLYSDITLPSKTKYLKLIENIKNLLRYAIKSISKDN